MITIGQKYNLLTPVEYVYHNGRNMVRCTCDCGGEIIVRKDAVLKGNNKSCGCIWRTHDATGTKEYRAWVKLKERCKGYDTHHAKHYKDRGITVCERWANSFENFLQDMGLAPSEKHSVDRKDVNGNYEPSNCRWATKDEQARNLRSNVFITYEGEIMILKDWCKRLGLVYTYTSYLIKHKKKTFEEIVKQKIAA